jgi:hypothetical protein
VKYVKAFGGFWYDFVIGDDWRIAIGVVVALGASAGLVRAGVPAWWVMPFSAIVILVASLWRAARSV